MRRHARSASAASTVTGMGWHATAKMVALTLVAFATLFVFAGRSTAATVTGRPFLFSFSDPSAGPLYEPSSIAIDNSTGDVYVAGQNSTGGGFVSKLGPDGAPLNFSATGTPLLTGFSNVPGVAVDNSGGASQGRLLVSQYGDSSVKAFAPSGDLEWTRLFGDEGQARDVAVDSAGHPWVPLNSFAAEYANSGNPPSRIFSFPTVDAAQIDVDANGNVYVTSDSGAAKYIGGTFDSILDPNANNVYTDQSSTSGHIFTSEEGVIENQRLEVDATAGQFKLAIAGEQTANLPYNASEQEIQTALESLSAVGLGSVEVFEFFEGSKYLIRGAGILAQVDIEQLGCEDGSVPLSGGSGCTVTTEGNGSPSGFAEYGSDGTKLGSFGASYLIAPKSIAYNPILDRVYVLQGGLFQSGGEARSNSSVVVFGPAATGTVAEVSIAAPSSIGVSSGHFSGVVNPQGTNSEWRFQWRKAGQSWADAASSPSQPLPADSSDHTVEYTTNALRGKSTYQVRLVAVNNANQLENISAIETFTTDTAAEPPAVTIDPPSAITKHAAKVTGTVDPNGDTANWRVQTSTDPACASGFSDELPQEVSPASSSPVAVEYELTGLLPAQHYCIRIVATNSAGSTMSEVKELDTLDTLPIQVFTAYAAPRTDTTARLNGYINPEGSEATYRFEYSEDGSNWTISADARSPRLRRQIVVGAEVSGLEPSTTYHYRFLVENGGGLVEGTEKTFQTRSSAEMQLPTRGIELINNPEKGTQNIASQRPIGEGPLVSEDGETAVWNTLSGAPNGNSSGFVNFLAKRTPSGWASKPIVPSAEKQAGGGSYLYKLDQITPDFHHFILRAALSEAQGTEPPTYVRIDDEQHSEDLKTLLPIAAVSEDEYRRAEVTNDGLHVLFEDFQNDQIEDISGGTPEIVSIMPDGNSAECGVAGYRMAATEASRLYFRAKPNGQSCSALIAIFYRDRNAEETVEVDPGPGSAMIRATPDGRSLYFITPNSHTAEDTNDGNDIYRWDAESNNYACLTCVVENSEVNGAIISDDLSRIYFSSLKSLIPGYGAQGDSNMYVLSSGELRFVADLSPPGGGGLQALSNSSLSTDGNVLVWRQADGYAQLTSDPLANQCRLVEGSTTCKQIFRYEDSTQSLECVSCAYDRVTNQSSSGGELNPRLSADGSTLAFSTTEALQPEDVNNTYDVYEWRNGARGLVTDGETQFPSSGFFTAPLAYGVDATGKNIFFTLIQPGLTGYERDEFTNLYDARIGGGFPRPQPPIHCSEESCQGPLQAPPNQSSAGSAGLAGSGNVPPAGKGRCAAKRGKARSRCLHKGKRHKQKTKGQKRAAQRNAGGAK